MSVLIILSAQPQQRKKMILMGLREEKQLRTRALIFSVASKLFTKHGFSAVTTQSISNEAKIAAGTLFRYASSKTELLLMVFNEKFRTALTIGKEQASSATDVRQAVLALFAPLTALTTSEQENALVYQRELLFGNGGTFQQEGLEIISDLEDIVTHLLLAEAEKTGQELSRDAAKAAAGSIFAVFHLSITRAANHELTGDEIQTIFDQQVNQILAGTLTSTNS